MLTRDDLRALVASGEIDTVIVAFTDMQGRLLGKRLHAEYFVEEMDAGHAVEGCNYLLALEMEMDPSTGCSASISSTKNSACRRLPSRRPCMSVNATTTVSTSPVATSSCSSANVSIAAILNRFRPTPRRDSRVPSRTRNR